MEEAAVRESDELTLTSSVPLPNGGLLTATGASLPHVPGIYIFKDQSGILLYVGKARDLKKRVSCYFRTAGPADIKTRTMLARARDLEYVVTNTEKEALLLEASLIKKHRPRYNVILRDDKNYPAIRINPLDPFPRLEIVRRFKKDGALYFGPYPSAHAVRETLHLLNQMFPLRHCKSRNLQPRQRPCLNYALGRCLGACAGKVTQEDYHKAVDEVVLFLRGRTDILQQQLRQRMQAAAASQDYERAALFRDRLQAIATTLEKQHMVSGRFLDQDVLGIHRDEAGTELAILFIRQGVFLGQRSFDLHDARGDRKELLSAFIQQYYSHERLLPDEIILPETLDEETLLEEWLSELKGKRVRLWIAQRGDRKRLLELAQDNARQRLFSRRKLEQDREAVLQHLQTILRLPRLPKRIAGIDISNLQGRHAVGSVVIFSDGKPDKSLYRRYRVRDKAEPDDPAMMAEIVDRWLTEEPSIIAGLDLVVLDGGKGQLHRISALLHQRALAGRLPLIALAKETEADVGAEGKGAYDKVFVPGRKNPHYLHHTPDVLHLLQRLRDEAHRFAISYYKKRHAAATLLSVLDQIPGIGPKRRQLLISHFGTVEAVRQATLADLQALPGISEPLARIILDHLHQQAEMAII
jgi:excinuclease ABC subunit C